MGRVVYNRNSGIFEYDLKYTNKMEALYEEMRSKRCELAAKVRKAQKLAIDMGDSAKMAVKKAEITAELEQLTIDISTLEEGITEYGQKDLESKNIVAQKRQERDKQREEQVVVNQKSVVDSTIKDTSLATLASDSNQNEIADNTPKFDEKKARIFIFPRHGWPSELANYLQGSNYTGLPIGTFSYDLTESRKNIYVEDAEELRKKFPVEFDQAFKNWDYIVKMNSPNNEP